MNLSLGEILLISLGDLKKKKIIIILLFCFILSFFFTLFFIYQLYINILDPAFQNFYNFLNTHRSEIFFLNYLLQFKFFNYILLLLKYLIVFLKFFILWFIFSIIAIPINNFITSFFYEKIFFEINKQNNYKWKFILKKNALYLSLKFSFFFTFIYILVNLLLLPMYFVLPFANFLIFIFVNSYFLGKEMCGGIMIQFFEKGDDKFQDLNDKNKNLLYAIGCVACTSQLIPILNFFSSGFAMIMFSHVILNHFNFKKKKLIIQNKVN